jgi:peptide deformylase
MPKDPIIQIGDPILRRAAAPVPKKDFGTKKLHDLIAAMSRILAKEEFGVAIAAPQVGVLSRIFVISGRAFIADLDDNEREGVPIPPDMAFINPEIIRFSRKKKEMSEGCLSVRSKYGTVVRHEKASVRAQDALGATFTYHGAGLVAHIFQHECDHLEGILYTDKAESLHDEKKKEKDHA